jgi:hypothetical protein
MLRYVLLLIALLVAPVAAKAEERFALLIGNETYNANGSFARLPAVPGDIQIVRNALLQAGFAERNVRVVMNAGADQMQREVRAFAQRLRASGGTGVGFFYFAGHGVEIEGQNYLIPSDLSIGSRDTARQRAIPAADIQTEIEASRNRLNLIVLDACRNDPFSRSGAGTGGLAPMTANARGTIVAFSTSARSTAEDGLYARHLANAIATPGLRVDDALRRVRTEVQQRRADQMPVFFDNLAGDPWYFIPPRGGGQAGTQTAIVQPPPPPGGGAQTTVRPPPPPSGGTQTTARPPVTGQRPEDIAAAFARGNVTALGGCWRAGPWSSPDEYREICFDEFGPRSGVTYYVRLNRPDGRKEICEDWPDARLESAVNGVITIDLPWVEHTMNCMSQRGSNRYEQAQLNQQRLQCRAVAGRTDQILCDWTEYDMNGTRIAAAQDSYTRRTAPHGGIQAASTRIPVERAFSSGDPAGLTGCWRLDHRYAPGSYYDLCFDGSPLATIRYNWSDATRRCTLRAITEVSAGGNGSLNLLHPQTTGRPCWNRNGPTDLASQRYSCQLVPGRTDQMSCLGTAYRWNEPTAVVSEGRFTYTRQ